MKKINEIKVGDVFLNEYGVMMVIKNISNENQINFSSAVSSSDYMQNGRYDLINTYEEFIEFLNKRKYCKIN